MRIDVLCVAFDVIQVEQLAGGTCYLYSVMETEFQLLGGATHYLRFVVTGASSR